MLDEFRIPWAETDKLLKGQVNDYRKIKSGIHISLLGTTRGGKTTLATGGPTGRGILSHFENCLLIDSTGDPGFISDYGKPLAKYGSIKGHRRLTVSNMSTESRGKIHKAVGKAVDQGQVAVYFDEIRQISDSEYFNLKKLVDYLYLFCAKRGVSVIGGTQAPRWIPSSVYDQSKIQFIFGMRDERVMKRLAEIAGDKNVRTVIPNLGQYEFAMIQTDGSMIVSKFEIPKSAPKVQPEKRIEIYRG